MIHCIDPKLLLQNIVKYSEKNCRKESSKRFGLVHHPLETLPMINGCFQNSGTSKSSILIRFSIINHPFWGTPIIGNIQMVVQISGSSLIPPEGQPFFSFSYTPWKMNGWFTYSHHPWKERKMIWTKPLWGHVPAVNLQGCIQLDDGSPKSLRMGKKIGNHQTSVKLVGFLTG